MRGLLFGFQHPRYRGIHVVIDRRENRMRRIMQRIVQIKQPGQTSPSGHA
jgi:hypothetical protein